jgi:hypothetical protein
VIYYDIVISINSTPNTEEANSMRKVITLIASVSLMLCLMTASAGAKLPQDLNTPKMFDINLGVPHWAVIETGIQSFSLNFTDLDWQAIALSETGRIVITSNDPIAVVIEQDWSLLAHELGITLDALLWTGGGDDDYVISPNIIVQPIEGSNSMTGLPGSPDNAMWYNSPTFTFHAGHGTNAFNIRMDARVNHANPRWTYLRAGSHKGTLTMTVSSAPGN